MLYVLNIRLDRERTHFPLFFCCLISCGLRLMRPHHTCHVRAVSTLICRRFCSTSVHPVLPDSSPYIKIQIMWSQTIAKQRRPKSTENNRVIKPREMPTHRLRKHDKTGQTIRSYALLKSLAYLVSENRNLEMRQNAMKDKI